MCLVLHTEFTQLQLGHGSLNEPLVSSLIHCSLVLNTAGGMKRLCEAIRSILQTPGQFVIKRNTELTEGAQAFKTHIMTLFAPPASQPRRRATILKITSLLLNGDWRSPTIEHICRPGCCVDEQDTLDKLLYSLPRLATSCNNGVFSRSNWAEWMEYWRFFGLLQGLHGLLSKAFVLAFSGKMLAPAGHLEEPSLDLLQVAVQEANLQHANIDIEDKADQMRQANAKSMKVALRFMSSSWYDRFLTMRTCLEPQVCMMAKLLKSSSAETELARHMSFEVVGVGAWTIFQTLNSGWTEQVFQDCHAALTTKTLYDTQAETEMAHTDTLIYAARPGAVIFQLVHCILQNFPFQLFSLIVDRSPAKATELLNTTKCRLDVFSKKFLAHFSSPEQLLGDDAYQILCACASKMKLSTSSTERLHSVNARAARGRVETHSIDISHLALQHMAYAGPSFIRRDKVVSQVKRAKGKGRGRPKKKSASGSAESASKRRRGGGGAWRAFVSAKSAGQRLDADSMRKLAEDFRALAPDERLLWQEHGSSGASFLPTPPGPDCHVTQLSQPLLFIQPHVVLLLRHRKRLRIYFLIHKY